MGSNHPRVFMQVLRMTQDNFVIMLFNLMVNGL